MMAHVVVLDPDTQYRAKQIIRLLIFASVLLEVVTFVITICLLIKRFTINDLRNLLYALR